MRIPTRPACLPLWRSILFVPAVSERFIESALRQSGEQRADLLQIDLEDSVGPAQKVEARAKVRGIAERFAAAGRDASVRVNRPWRMLIRDLEAAVCPAVKAIALPKVPDASFVHCVAEVLDELEREQGLASGHTRIIAMVEDAEGLHHIDAIAAAHPRMVGLIVGAEDLAVAMRMAVADDSLYVPNVMAVIAARRAPRWRPAHRLHRLGGRFQGRRCVPRAHTARPQARLRERVLRPSVAGGDPQPGVRAKRG